jgi:hypothetical protein
MIQTNSFKTGLICMLLLSVVFAGKLSAQGATCAEATVINCGQTVTGTTAGGTTQAVPTCVTTLNTAPGVWYSFVGNGDLISASTCGAGTAYDSKLGVFSGSCAALVCVTGNDDACGLQSTATFQSVAGTTYFIYITGFGAGAGNYSMTLTCVVPATNDLCSGAIQVLCGTPVNGTTLGSGTDAVGTCVTTLNTAGGIWYKVQGGGGNITASLCGSGYDCKIGVFSGSCGALVCVTGNDDFCGLQSQVTFNATDGVEYYILVTGFGAATGNFTLTVTGACGAVGPPPPPPNPPANDSCSNNITLECGIPLTGTTVDATSNAVPSCGPPVNGGGVWYSFTTDDAIVNLSVCADSVYLSWGIYSGSCEGLTCLAGTFDGCAGESITFVAEEGVQYFVYVHSAEAEEGEFTIELNCQLCPYPITSPWVVSAIGGATGVANSECDGTYTISATGAGTPTNDMIHFAHQEICGDGSITAKINSFTKFTYGGVQFRDGTGAGARKFALMTQLGTRVLRELRTVDGGAHSASNLAAARNPAWVRVSRSGDTFTGYVSVDGNTWTQVAQTTIAGMPSCLRAGFHTQSQLVDEGTVNFGNVSITSGAPAFQGDFSNRNFEETTSIAVAAYPNPANNELNIRMADLQGSAVQINVMNALGQLVLQKRIDAVNELELLDISKLSGGMYILQVNNQLPLKFIIEK